jgi:hypothetical protein
MLQITSLLNAVTSTPFLSAFELSSKSSTVFTVFVEWPSTKPNDDTAERPCVENLDAIRRRRGFFVLTGTSCRQAKTKGKRKMNKHQKITLMIVIMKYFSG